MLHLDFPGELFVGQPTPYNVAHHEHEAVKIRHVPVIVAKRLLVKVAEQVERFDRHLGSFQTALQKTPEVLKAVRVDIPVDVLNRVVNHPPNATPS